MNFVTYPDERWYRTGEKQKWEDALKHRRETVRSEPTLDDTAYLEFLHDVNTTLNDRGFGALAQAVDIAKLHDVRDSMEHFMNEGKNLWRGHNKPQSELRKTEAFTAIEQPLLCIPSILDVIFDSPLLHDIASQYCGAPVGLSGLNLRKSFVNSREEIETQVYHVDPNSPRFLKMFFYLNDVDIDGGPFQYVENSYKTKFEGWQDPYRRTDAEVHSIYGTEKVHRLTGKVGDVVMADTNAFHKGTKPKSADRGLLTIDWCIHPEFFQSPVFKIRRSDINRINQEYEWTRGREYLWDFLIIEE